MKLKQTNDSQGARRRVPSWLLSSLLLFMVIIFVGHKGGGSRHGYAVVLFPLTKIFTPHRLWSSFV